MANALTQMTGLVRLEVPYHGLSEQQLSSLCVLTRLTHLAFRSDQLGVLLLDRLKSLRAKTSSGGLAVEVAAGKVNGWKDTPAGPVLALSADRNQYPC